MWSQFFTWNARNLRCISQHGCHCPCRWKRIRRWLLASWFNQFLSKSSGFLLNYDIDNILFRWTHWWIHSWSTNFPTTTCSIQRRWSLLWYVGKISKELSQKLRWKLRCRQSRLWTNQINLVTKKSRNARWSRWGYRNSCSRNLGWDG